ncbi:UDP-N-acetylmuramoyl-L-alanyl-D-glutamate--2,6-diaminopimelate ligase [bacterium]|nr:UDP-N-acetylmuramoyl-L-alanyl-D-glutamate--2,6-diaminopimelate ligase [bacterium]
MAPDLITLGALAARVSGRVVGDPTVLVSDVTHDSRAAGPGVLFVAVRGFTVDGHRYVANAIEAGSRAVCLEEAPAPGIDAIVVEDTRAALGPLAAAVHGDPSSKLALVGVTGTNGKTTVTHLLESIVTEAGLTPAVVGTVGARVAGVPIPVERTTPEAPEFQRLIAQMVTSGVHVGAVEVSSHALSLGRVAGTRFRVAGFTNLSQDHLDFHEDMEAYFAAKALLFTPGYSDAAVIWVDDPAGRRLADGSAIPVTTVGLTRGCDVNASGIRMNLSGSSLVIGGPGGSAECLLPLPGDFNVANALVAAGCAAVIGIPWDSIAAGITHVPRVPGRFEVVETGADFTVVVDYAHTPDGIAKVIAATRPLVGQGRVITVVGAGGDRDRAKRPFMGAAASLADIAVLTSDNPRSEDPFTVMTQVAAGAIGPAHVVTEVDRRLAIRAAVGMAAPGDVVLVLGKGHEQGQQFATGTIPFDDRTVAREEVASL